jgi:hypothetical protein
MAKSDPKNTAFKVGDEVVRRAQPFELCEIIKQLPSIADGERRYCVSSPAVRGRAGTVIKTSALGKQRDVRENELMRLDEALDELLDFAKAESSNATRNALLAALCCARIDYDRLTKKLPPAKLVKDLETSVTTTRKLLAKLTKYGIPREIEGHVCKIGAGVVDVLPLPFEVPKTFRAFQSPPFEGTAIVVIQNLLGSWHDSIKMVLEKNARGRERNTRPPLSNMQYSFPVSTLPVSLAVILKTPSMDLSSNFTRGLPQLSLTVVSNIKSRRCCRVLQLYGRRGALEIDRPKS